MVTSVGSSRIASAASWTTRELVEERGQRAELRRQLLLAEDEQREVDGGLGAALLELARQLEQHGEPALHVARAEAHDGAVLDPAGDVLLRRNRVVVAGEDDERPAVPPRRREDEGVLAARTPARTRRHERGDVSGDLGLVAALGGDVDELERPLGQPVRERWHRRKRGTIPCVTTRQARHPAAGVEPERGFVVAVLAKGTDAEDELGELRELARTAGVEPVAELVQQRAHPDPRTYVGKGKLEELKQAYGDAGAEVLLVDDELDPVQQRALENALDARVVDRTQLILDIFAQHAGAPRASSRSSWRSSSTTCRACAACGSTSSASAAAPARSAPASARAAPASRSSRPTAGSPAAGSRCCAAACASSASSAAAAQGAARSGTPIVALAGYTNVGKSTLLNALTGAEVSVENRLFETLDPTTRGFEHDGKRYLVTDTVGFIRRLPTQLVEGFASTLEETLVADLVLHVVDASASDERLDEMIDSVETVLHEIGADDLPLELVLNKIDRVDPLGRRRLANRFPDALQVAAATGEGLDGLRERIAEPLRRPLRGGQAAAAVRPGREARRALRARRADRGAGGRQGGRARPRAPAAARGAPLRAATSLPTRLPLPRSGSDVIELAITRLREDA